MGGRTRVDVKGSQEAGSTREEGGGAVRGKLRWFIFSRDGHTSTRARLARMHAQRLVRILVGWGGEGGNQRLGVSPLTVSALCHG